MITMLPNLQAKMPWNILRDFEPVSLVATIEWGLVVAVDAPQRSAADLIAAARKAPGQIWALAATVVRSILRWPCLLRRPV